LQLQPDLLVLFFGVALRLVQLESREKAREERERERERKGKN
jgi:hypothetical protein